MMVTLMLSLAKTTGYAVEAMSHLDPPGGEPASLRDIARRARVPYAYLAKRMPELVAAGLVELKQHAAANQPDEFFVTLFRLLQEQLGERLDCPASAITENVVDEHGLLQTAPAALRDALREQFQLCNQARYAPVRGASELNSVAAQFEKLIHELQELKA